MKNKEEQKTKKSRQEPNYLRWVLRIFLLSVSLSAVLSLCSGAVLDGAGLATAIGILLLFVFLGIVFDVIGVAATAADPKPFHAMAAHRVKGAKQALRLIKNADKVASFCNDVVGDICGIVSGSTAAVIVTQLKAGLSVNVLLLSTAVTALISGLTIGGKALGKRFAIVRCKKVVFSVARLMAVLRIGS